VFAAIAACVLSFGFSIGVSIAAEEATKGQEPKGQKAQDSPQDLKADSKKEKDKEKDEPKAPGKPSESKPSPSSPSEKATDAKAADAKKDKDKKEKEEQEEKEKAEAPAPKPQEPKPAELTAKPPMPPILPVKLALMADPRLFPYEIEVEMNGDIAELSGKVSNEAEKAAAAEVAQSVDGVKSIVNKLEVVKDLSRTLGRKKDDIITTYVKDRFAKSKTLETARFDVKTEDGVVSLGGKVKFLVIVLEAAEAARQVPGVKAVKTDGVRVEASD
jgi:hyperosmotically inducible protein